MINVEKPYILAVIPARAGSKGLPDKNRKSLRGHPLFSYSIAAALESRLIQRTIVSTDSEDYARIAIHYGAEVPFLRPREISQDLSTDVEFFQHALNFLKSRGQRLPDAVVLLRPTSPLRWPGLVDQAIELLLSSTEATCVRAVTRAPHTPLKMWSKDGIYLKPAATAEGIEEAYNMPRQMLPPFWISAGVVDVVRTQSLLEGSASGDRIIPFEIDPKDFCDIDRVEDFELAAAKMENGGYIVPKTGTYEDRLRDFQRSLE